MLIAQVMRTGWEGPRRYVFASEQATLVKGPGTEVQLIEGHHESSAGVVNAWRRLRISAQGGVPIYVNGKSVDGSRDLAPGDEVRVGLFRYRFWLGEPPATIDRTPYRASDPTEQQLIDELAHPATRGVYADWLDHRGEVAQAAWLRAQDALVAAPSEGAAALRGQLTALAADVTAGWRAIVASPPIERCEPRFRFACPAQWGDLVRTDRDEVRRCRTCERDVHYAISVGEARSHAHRGDRVALDVTCARWRDDLEPPYGMRCHACGSDRSPRYPRFDCEHCGVSVLPPGVEID